MKGDSRRQLLFEVLRNDVPLELERRREEIGRDRIDSEMKSFDVLVPANEGRRNEISSGRDASRERSKIDPPLQSLLPRELLEHLDHLLPELLSPGSLNADPQVVLGLNLLAELASERLVDPEKRLDGIDDSDADEVVPKRVPVEVEG